ncbi:MAG: hypothetical protein AAF517_25620, partial [Planctomycetota bacterium]
DPLGVFDSIVNSLSGLFESQIEDAVRSAVETTAEDEIVPILATAFGSLAFDLNADPVGLSTALADIVETGSNLQLRFEGAWSAGDVDPDYPSYSGFGVRRSPLPAFPLAVSVPHPTDAAISLSVDSLDQALAALASTGALSTSFEIDIKDSPIPVTTGGLAELVESRWLRLPGVDPEAPLNLHLSIRSPPRFTSLENQRAPIVRAGSTWRYLPGESEPSTGWVDIGFADSSWSRGPSGFGYSSNEAELTRVRTEPAGMSAGDFTSLYLRRTFTVRDPETLPGVTLRLEYDDAFVAFLNGEEVGRSNIDGSRPAFDELASSAGEPTTVEIDLANSGALRDGLNVLAIQGHNASSESSDFVLTPEVLAARPLPPGGQSSVAGELTLDNVDLSIRSGDTELFAVRLSFRLAVRVVYANVDGQPVLLFDLDSSDGPDEDALPDAIVGGGQGIDLAVARESYDSPDFDLIVTVQLAITLLGSGLSDALDSLELPAIPLPTLDFDLSGDGAVDTRLNIGTGTLASTDADGDGEDDWICLLADLASEDVNP